MKRPVRKRGPFYYGVFYGPPAPSPALPTPMCGRERPIIDLLDKPSRHRIVLYIRKGPFKLIRRAHEAIEIFASPKRTSSSGRLVDRMRRDRLPSLDDFRQRMPRKLLRNDVNMRRHNAPCGERVSLTIIMQKATLDLSSMVRMGEEAGAVAIIQDVVRPFGAFDWIYERARNGLRHRIGESEDDVLNKAAFVAVRQVSARAPALVIHALRVRAANAGGKVAQSGAGRRGRRRSIAMARGA